MKRDDNNLGLSINSLKETAVEMMEKCEVIVEEAVNAMVTKDIEKSKEIIGLDDDMMI